MRKVLIIGGKLQGLEAAYLGKKAGYETTVVDRDCFVPAKGLCNRFLCLDVNKKGRAFIDACENSDIILPAMENREVLNTLLELKEEYDFNIAFDFHAYGITSSKLNSDKLMRDNYIPCPVYYPQGSFPYIAKPSSESGSVGVTYIENESKYKAFIEKLPKGEDWIIQEFIQGASYSMEVIGSQDNYKTYEVTQIHMDERYDCKMVTVPCHLPLELKKEFSRISVELADKVGLKGIMDVEVIENKGRLKVLEIDARIPSQTPIAIYHSTGVNFLEEIDEVFSRDFIKKKKEVSSTNKYVAFEQLEVTSGVIREKGEHITGESGPLSLKYDFCYADEVLTNYEPNKNSWMGTFITMGENKEELEEKRKKVRDVILLL